MSLQQETRKAPYYPRVELTEKHTNFGAVETNHPDLYTRPLDGKWILEVDTLSALIPLWGESILQSAETRLLTYQLVSGSCTEKKLQQLAASFYVKHRKFTDFADNAFHFGNEEDSLLTRLIKPAREAILSYTQTVLSTVEKSGGRVVMLTHDYVYSVFKHNKLPDFSHSRVIK